MSGNAATEGRDFPREMRRLIDAETSHGPYVSRIIAREIVEKLEVNDPDLLNGWLLAQAEQLIWSAINDRDRSRRASARTSAGRSAFGAAVREHEAGVSAALTGWLGCRFVVEDGTRCVLADLTRADLLFVAEGYEADSRGAAMEAAFFRAIAKKVRTGRVADHFDEARLAELRRSLA